MSIPASSPVNPSPGLIRRLKLALVIMVVSNLSLGCFSVYLLRTLDASYSGLLDRSLPLMTGLRQLTKETVSMQRHVLASLVAQDPVQRADAKAKLKESTEKQHRLLDSLLRSAEFAARPELSAAMRGAAQTYETGLVSFDRELKSGNWKAADQVRNEILRPTIASYLSLIDQAAVAVEASSQSINEDYSNQVRTHSTILLGLASWPLMVAFIVTLVVAVIIAVLVFVYRQVGTEQY